MFTFKTLEKDHEGGTGCKVNATRERGGGGVKKGSISLFSRPLQSFQFARENVQEC